MTARTAFDHITLKWMLHANPRVSQVSDILQGVMYDALVAAYADGRLRYPEALMSHDMPLGYAMADLVAGKKASYALDDFTRWMARAHLDDVASAASRLRRAQPDAHVDDLLLVLIETAHHLLESGSFAARLPRDSDLVRSAWNGCGHELHLENWEIVVKSYAIGPMRLGRSLRPLRPAPIPDTIEIEMRLQTGRLYLGSDLPLKLLNEHLVALRQAPETRGLQGDIAVADQALDELHIVAMPAHHRSLRVVTRGDDTAILAAADADVASEGQIAELLLDYRYLTLADERALIESLRQSWDENEETLLWRFKEEVAAQGSVVPTISVAPGRYRITLPANHARQLSGGVERFPEAEAVLLTLTRIGDR